MEVFWELSTGLKSIQDWHSIYSRISREILFYSVKADSLTRGFSELLASLDKYDFCEKERFDSEPVTCAGRYP